MKPVARLNSIQTLRAIAAWMVVFHHFMQLFYNFKSNSWIGSFFIRFGSLGVDIFFIISGFVIYISTTNKKISPIDFFLMRLARVAPAYWFFTLITSLVLCYSTSIVPLSSFDPVFLLKCILFIPGGATPYAASFYPLLTVGWTLNYEMAFYLIYSVTLYLRLSKRLLAVAAGLLTMNLIVPKMGGNFEFYNNQITYEFFIGVLIAVFWCKNYVQRINLAGAVVLVLIAISILKHYPENHHYLRTGIPCGMLVCALLSQERLFKQNFMAHLGNWSYSTYLCHVLILSFAHKASQVWQLNALLVLCASCAAILLVSYLSFAFLETPVLKLSKRYLKWSNPFGGLMKPYAVRVSKLQ